MSSVPKHHSRVLARFACCQCQDLIIGSTRLQIHDIPLASCCAIPTEVATSGSASSLDTTSALVPLVFSSADASWPTALNVSFPLAYMCQNKGKDDMSADIVSVIRIPGWLHSPVGLKRPSDTLALHILAASAKPGRTNAAMPDKSSSLSFLLYDYCVKATAPCHRPGPRHPVDLQLHHWTRSPLMYTKAA